MSLQSAEFGHFVVCLLCGYGSHLVSAKHVLTQIIPDSGAGFAQGSPAASTLL